MSTNSDEQLEEFPSFDPVYQTERIAFEPSQMIACGKCGRVNPPNRLKCIYCANDLEIPTGETASLDLRFRKPELWEPGFNIIFSGKAAEVIDVPAAAKLLSLQPFEVQSVLEANVPLPLARVENETGASIVTKRLFQLGITARLIPDAELLADQSPVRLGRIDFRGDRLEFKAFNTGFVTVMDANDLDLIIPGVISVGKVDSTERKGRRGQTKLVDETQIDTDETVLDLYCRNDPSGFRIQLAGFDFSCLGEEKTMLAAENIRRLIAKLRACCPNAQFVDNYSTVIPLLDPIWEVETRKDQKGLQKTGIGKRGFGTVSSRNNLNQFTKFSRLQRRMYERADQEETG